MVAAAPGSYVPAADRPELYLEAFMTSHRHTGRGVGRQLLAAVIREATSNGAEQVGADCWAGGDGRLLRYYEQQGFTIASVAVWRHGLKTS